MFEQWYGPGIGSDREYLVSRGVIPALGTIGAMAVAFSVVAGILFVAEGLIVNNVVTQTVAILVMYALPPFAVGLWVGKRHGLLVAPAIAIGVAPIMVLITALAAFSGPVLTLFDSPLLLVGAVAGWSALSGFGIAVGSKLVKPWLTE
ncbi:hypothetical protein ACFQJ7_04205 [Halovenus rubra]|uniref:Uncharacterized protein n=2 Tax=Halovenus rubra TaxID=869890 RepID=A0ABD5X2N8_9EURY|nr:hypothetical protein [Halovenus rubra]